MFERIIEEAKKSKDPEFLLAVIADMHNYIKQLESGLAGAREQEELWKQYAQKLEEQLPTEYTKDKFFSVFSGIGEFARDTLYPEKE